VFGILGGRGVVVLPVVLGLKLGLVHTNQHYLVEMLAMVRLLKFKLVLLLVQLIVSGTLGLSGLIVMTPVMVGNIVLVHIYLHNIAVYLALVLILSINLVHPLALLIVFGIPGNHLVTAMQVVEDGNQLVERPYLLSMVGNLVQEPILIFNLVLLVR